MREQGNRYVGTVVFCSLPTPPRRHEMGVSCGEKTRALPFPSAGHAVPSLRDLFAGRRARAWPRRARLRVPGPRTWPPRRPRAAEPGSLRRPARGTRTHASNDRRDATAATHHAFTSAKPRQHAACPSGTPATHGLPYYLRILPPSLPRNVPALLCSWLVLLRRRRRGVVDDHSRRSDRNALLACVHAEAGESGQGSRAPNSPPFLFDPMDDLAFGCGSLALGGRLALERCQTSLGLAELNDALGWQRRKRWIRKGGRREGGKHWSGWIAQRKNGQNWIQASGWLMEIQEMRDGGERGGG